MSALILEWQVLLWYHWRIPIVVDSDSKRDTDTCAVGSGKIAFRSKKNMRGRCRGHLGCSLAEVPHKRQCPFLPSTILISPHYLHSTLQNPKG
jgi:hypothetical protein